jgi:C_GCAxxG_C_C family probable redox protein
MSTETAIQSAAEYFDSGYICSESVLLAISRAMGIESDLIPRIATGFGGGLARTCSTCGAVNGAVMAISLFYGRNSPDETQLRAYEAVRRFLAAFRERFGYFNCQELTGVDLGTEEGYDAYWAKGFYEKCNEITARAVEIAMSIIETRGESDK